MTRCDICNYEISLEKKDDTICGCVYLYLRVDDWMLTLSRVLKALLVRVGTQRVDQSVAGRGSAARDATHRVLFAKKEMYYGSSFKGSNAHNLYRFQSVSRVQCDTHYRSDNLNHLLT